MKIFLILTLVFGLVVGGLFAVLFTPNVRGWKKVIAYIITMLLTGATISGLMCFEVSNDATLWNGGTCPIDGAEWRFTNADRLRNSSILYFYCCDECGKIIQLHSQN